MTKTLQEKIDCNVFEIPYDLTNGKYLNALIVNKAIQELREEIEALRTCKHCDYCIGLGHVLDRIGEKK